MRPLKTSKIIILLFLSTSLYVNSQENKQSAFTFNYNYQIPIGELADLFGNSSTVGASYFFQKHNNIIFGIDANYMFGNDLHDEGIFENISTSSGAIIGGDGYYTNINLMQRGWSSHAFIGYAFNSTKDLSGFYISQGIGYLQYQIFIDTKNQNVPQLTEEMKKGYDRFSNGYSTKLAVDYKYYHKGGRLQILAGMNYTMAYTKTQRTYDFANSEYYPQSRKWDKLIGFNIGVIIPINRKNSEEFHYY